MSIYGMQLPKQISLQKQTGPVERNKGFANHYQTPVKNITTSFQWTSYQKPKSDLYNAIAKGNGTVLKNDRARTSQNFDVTMRNTYHPFHSQGVRQISFNDQKFCKLANESRFRIEGEDGSVNPKKKPDFYDIKGNTWKQTLIPAETTTIATKKTRSSITDMDNDAFKQFANTYTDGFMSSAQKVQPKHTRGYLRSGMILFNNINQVNVGSMKTPRAKKNTIEPKTPQPERDTAGPGSSENYKLWVKQNPGTATEKRAVSVMKRPSPIIPVRAAEEIEKNIEMSASYSPEFRLKKANNYDNTISNAPRTILENTKIQRYFHRKPAFSATRNSKLNNSPYINLGHACGPGGRAVLYGTVRKEHVEKRPSTQNTTRVSKSSHVLQRNQLAASIKSWNHYDTNLKEHIGIQKKIIQGKNSELDNRALSINQYGYQPLFKQSLDKQRMMNGILLEQTKGKAPEERLPLYKRKYTPITSYVKQLHDTRISQLYDNKMTVFRPNVNF